VATVVTYTMLNIEVLFFYLTFIWLPCAWLPACFSDYSDQPMCLGTLYTSLCCLIEQFVYDNFYTWILLWVFSPHLWWNENVQVISPSWWPKKKTWTSMRSSDVLAWLVSCHSLLIYWFRMIGSISWTIEMSYMFSCCLIWTKLNYCEFSKFISE
jgi:hypothetical protein